MDSTPHPQQQLDEVLRREAQLLESGAGADPMLVAQRSRYLHALARNVEALAASDEAMALFAELDPTAALEHLPLRGTILQNLGRLDDALLVLQDAEERAIAAGLPPDPMVPHTRGWVLYRNNRHLEALAEFERCNEIRREQQQPELPAAYSGIGACLLRQRRPDESLAAFRRQEELYAEQGQPPAPTMFSNRASAYMQLHYMDEAIESLDSALSSAAEQGLPVSPFVYANRGGVYLSTGRYVEGLADLDRAERMFSDRQEPVFPGIYVNRGIVYTRIGNYEQALEEFDRSDRAFSVSGGKPWLGTEVQRASCLSSMGRHDEAMAAFSRAEQQHTEEHGRLNWDFYFHRAICLNAAGRHEEALDDIYRSIESCVATGTKQPPFLRETLRDWITAKPAEQVQEQRASQPAAQHPVPDSDKQWDAFICYRRREGGGHAMLLQTHLEMAELRVFTDRSGLQAGDFRENLRRAVSGSRFLLVVLSEGFFKRCISDPEDVTRLELETALDCGTHIIPVMMEGFVWPDPQDLPAGIRQLANVNAISFSSDFFTAFMDKLLRWME